MKVTVLMVTYNHEKFIADAINSIFNQSYKQPFDFIISDDCSSDKTPKIISNVIKNAPSHINCMYYRHKENISGVENFNFCLSKISDGLIIVADGDDISKTDRINKIINIHKVYKKDLYISNADEIDVDGSLTNKKRYTETFNLENIGFNDIYTNKVPVFGASYAFDFSLIKKYGYIDSVYVTKNNVDQNLFWRAVQNRGVYYIDDSLLFYRSHIGGTSISRRRNEARKNGYIVTDILLTINININIMGNLIYIIKNELQANNKLMPLFVKLRQEFNSLQNLLSSLENLDLDAHIKHLEYAIKVYNFLIDIDYKIEDKNINSDLIYILFDKFLNRPPTALEIKLLLEEKNLMKIIERFSINFKTNIKYSTEQAEKLYTSKSNLYIKDLNTVVYNNQEFDITVKSLRLLQILDFIKVINFIIAGDNISKTELDNIVGLFKQKKLTKREVALILFKRKNRLIKLFINEPHLIILYVLRYNKIKNMQHVIFEKGISI